MRPRRQAGEECGESSRSGAQYFSFNFLSDYSFSGLGIAAYGEYGDSGRKVLLVKALSGNRR
jgi:hypothetical protein